MRKHGSLVHDEEVNDAAWVAARGAVVGAAKVSLYARNLVTSGSVLINGISEHSGVFLQQ